MKKSLQRSLAYRAAIPPVADGIVRPRWSVMIPTYNCARYLRETLTSVLAQDLGPDVMQIEVVDDHSTEDDPARVVDEIGGGRVSFFRQPENVGYIRNFETCLQRTKGTLVHLLHGDDFVLNGFYNKMDQAFEQSPEIGAAFCRHYYVDEEGHRLSSSLLERPQSGILKRWLMQIASGQRIATPSIVVRRTVYERLGGFDRRITCAGEDWEMWVRIAAHYPVWFEAEVLAAYRVKRDGALTEQAVRSHRLVRDMRLATEIIESYLPRYLPALAAHDLTQHARETYAKWALEGMNQALGRGELFAASRQTYEALRCSTSRRTIRSVARLLANEGKHWMRRKTGRVGPLIEHQSAEKSERGPLE